MELPAWMGSGGHTASMPGRVGRRPSFVRRAAGRFARLLEEMLANEQTALAPGLLQSLDARAKILGLLGLVVGVTLLQQPLSLGLACALGLLLASLSRLPLRRVLRLWLVVPLFSGALILPATLNLVTPGPALLLLWRPAGLHFLGWPLPPTVAVTAPGLVVAGRFVLRVGVCVTLALLLTATTRPDRLLHGLQALGVPRLFVMLLAVMQRYLLVLLQAAQEIHLARLSRTVAPGSTRQEQAWVAAGMGSLLRRTQALGEAVCHAMVARGYTGQVHLPARPRWTSADWSFLAAVACFITLLLRVG